ncbi:hypothetical protein HU200_000431 [Digitaria exilis]|uniref:Uncharacterized protein n=1 Tax=Digitaria exilis TaxID=1010633 RepID=A0A835G2Z5_9POAL|nr:hypothetical protein HU200_000431 [Digitaria exilis]
MSINAIRIVIVSIILLTLVISLTPPSPVTSPKSRRKSRDIIVRGCNNNCSVACCYCNIQRSPPVCERCCG